MKRKTSRENNSLVSAWIDAGILQPPTRKKGDLAPSPVNVSEGVALDLLRKDRGESDG